MRNPPSTTPTTHAQSTQTKPTIPRVINPNEINRPRAIYPNETVGAVPACPPERPHSGVSIRKIHASCVGIERWMRPCGATRAGTQAPPLPIPIIFSHAIPHKPNNHLHTIQPNKTNRSARNLPKRNRRGGACVPARTSAQRRFHNKNTRIVRGHERWKRPCRATRAGTQAPPLPISIIFFYAIPHKQNNHSRVINPNEINRPRAICPNETVGAVPVCPPERPHSGVSIPKTHALCVGNGRWMRPCGATRAGTQAPPLPILVIFFHTNKITIYAQFAQTKPTVPRAICPNETVGAAPVCPPERPHSGVSIPKTHGIMCGNERWMRPYGATRAGTQEPPLPRSVIFFHAIPHK